MSDEPKQLSLLEPQWSSVPPPPEYIFTDELDDFRALLAVASVPRIGFSTMNGLFQLSSGRLSNVWSVEPDLIQEEMRRRRNQNPAESVAYLFERRDDLLERADRKMEKLIVDGVRVCFRGSRNYPHRLMQLEAPPNWVFVQGDLGLIRRPRRIAAVVGTREPTDLGLQSAEKIASIVMQQGGFVLSGLAEGIDASAQQVAVDFGIPTIAVLGHGLDVVFPSKTASLRTAIIERGGALVTEYLPSDTYSRERFVQRNRIQAALSSIVVIAEARSKSGTAHTLRFGRELGKPVVAATVDGILTSRSTELLREMQRHGDAVYFLGDADGADTFRSSLDYFFARDEPHGIPLTVFGGAVEEIKRLARRYAATSRDYAWLIKEIRTIRSKRSDGD